MSDHGTERTNPAAHGEPEPMRDPVCGMDLAGLEHLSTATRRGVRYSFCGPGCASRFHHEPDRFFGEPLIKIRGLRKSFSFGDVATHVLRGIDLNIWPGDFIAIVGASGSGKSTLLNMLGLLDRPTEGNIHIKHRDAGGMSDDERALLRSRTFGFVFQQYNLIPWLSARDNILLPLIFSRKKNGAAWLEEQLGAVGLTDRAHHHPMELSGGEQQRVALLRALANDPEMVIGDEPTGNLDSRTGRRILDMLIELHDTQDKTIVIVTHDLSIAEMAEEIITLKDGLMVRDGRVHLSRSVRQAIHRHD